MLVGRKKEQGLLEKCYKSAEAEFVVIYGRRRIGKTYLIREFFAKKVALIFEATGMQKGKLQTQLKNFADSLTATFVPGVKLEVSKSWMESFQQLTQFISQHKSQKKKEKIVLFFDELPWMATRKSGLLQAIDYYWNHHWSKMPNIILICCGSSASWLIRNIIYNKGGLHNRVTCEIKLNPFSLSETKAFLKNRKIKLSNQHILSLYMALGGVPYYLRYVERGLTAAQNIQNIIFNKDAPLRGEFNKLFRSLFKDGDVYIELIRLIAKRKEGVRRSELEASNKFSAGGGRLTSRIKDLCEAGFIEEYVSWKKTRGEYYKLIDEFSLFYLHWVEKKKSVKFTKDHWVYQSNQPSYKAWAGYAFESICMKHIDQVCAALNIATGGIVSSWRFVPTKKIETGVQIDLLIDRNDNAITLCEIKYTIEPFIIDKQYATKLQHKIEVFKKKTKIKKQIFLVIISANGLKPSMHSEEMVDGLVVLDDLFKEK
jgi:AAA+ ATPase superfamily predicted ATPase